MKGEMRSEGPEVDSTTRTEKALSSLFQAKDKRQELKITFHSDEGE